AAQQPVINWDNVTGIGRLVDLLSLKDFGRGTGALLSPAGSQSPTVLKIPGTMGIYFAIFGEELGILALLLAGWGLAQLYRRRLYATASPLVVLFAFNLLGATFQVGPAQ